MIDPRHTDEFLAPLLYRYGAHTASYVLTEGRARLFRVGGIDGCLGWEPRSGCRVIAGDPLCAPEVAPALLTTFRRRSWPRPVLAYAVTPTYCRAFRAAGFGAEPVGAEATFDPRRFHLGGGGRALLRAAVNHAVKQGVEVTELPLPVADATTAAELTDLSAAWLVGKGGDELGFLLGEPVFDQPTHRRTFLARSRTGRIEGFLTCAPIRGRGGWYLDITRRRQDAVRGTMELLTTIALQTFGREGAAFASMGLSPLARLDAPDVPPGDSLEFRKLGAAVFASVRSPYDYASLARYKGKYSPDAWEYRYLCYSGRIAEWAIRQLLQRLLRRAANIATTGEPGRFR